MSAYSEPHRHYHTTAHIDACLAELDLAGDLASDRGEVEVALWFHDAIYRSWRHDNEQRSADLAAETLRAAPVESVGWSSKTGVKVSPPSVVFHTPPPAAAT